MYGIDLSKKTSTSLFNKEDAERALKDAKFCVINVKKLLESIKDLYLQKQTKIS